VVASNLGPEGRGWRWCTRCQPLQLPVPSRLASWNRAGDPDQVRLAAHLDAVEALLRPRLEQLSGPLALRLDVGLPGAAALLDQRDLDNYLLPLAARLSRVGTGALAGVCGTKHHAGGNSVVSGLPGGEGDSDAGAARWPTGQGGLGQPSHRGFQQPSWTPSMRTRLRPSVDIAPRCWTAVQAHISNVQHSST
jgi:hypothetical protein